MEQQNTPHKSEKTKLVSKTNALNTSMVTKSIEHAADNGGKNSDEPKPFLTKKKIILTLIFVLISIGFVVVTVRPILKVDWNVFNQSVGAGIAKNLGWLWFFLLLVQLFININRGFFTLIPRLRKWGYKISYGDYMLYSLTQYFIMAVSPANFVSDPYTIFWLKTHGVPTSQAVSLLFTNSLLWQISQIVVTLPFFFICCAFSGALIHKSPLDHWLFAMICIGVIIDFVGLIFMFLMNWSKNFHYFCSRIFNWFKKKFHMKYHTKEQIIAKYKDKAVLKQSFIDSMRDWKTTLYILLAWIAGEILGLFAIIFSLCFVQNMVVINAAGQYEIVHVSFNVGWSLVCARLSVPANRLNFLPGQAMGYEAALVELLDVYGGWKIAANITPEQKSHVSITVVRNSVLTGKIFLAWLPAVIGIGGFAVLTKQQIKLSNQGKLITK